MNLSLVFDSMECTYCSQSGSVMLKIFESRHNKWVRNICKIFLFNRPSLSFPFLTHSPLICVTIHLFVLDFIRQSLLSVGNSQKREQKNGLQINGQKLVPTATRHSNHCKVVNYGTYIRALMQLQKDHSFAIQWNLAD